MPKNQRLRKWKIYWELLEVESFFKEQRSFSGENKKLSTKKKGEFLNNKFSFS